MALLVLRSVGVVCRAKPNVPLVRWQKNKKMCVGQKLNLCLVSLSARFFCPFGLGSVVRYHCCQRFSALRSGGLRSTTLSTYRKCRLEVQSYKFARNPPLRKTAVRCWRSCQSLVCLYVMYLLCYKYVKQLICRLCVWVFFISEGKGFF